MENMLRDLAPGSHREEERRRFLLVDNPSLEATSRHHSGCANLPEAAQAVDIVRALLPAIDNGAIVRVVVDYQLQRAVLETGWPQSGRSISVAPSDKPRPMAKGRARKGQPRLAGPPHPPTYATHTKDHASVFVQHSSPLTGLDLCFPGLRQLADKHLANGRLTISTIDSSQGSEADLVIYLTTRSNKWHDWDSWTTPTG
eukprot:9323842-Pyramimonas_sp.AAC.1